MKDHARYSEFLELMGATRQLKGFKHHGIHITVNTIHELEDAEQNIDKFQSK